MKSLRIPVIVLSALLGGCFAVPQTITIETAPSGAAISVDHEYIGRSPVDHDIKDIRKLNQLKIVAEIANYNLATKTIKKLKPQKERFPNAIFLKLDQTAALGANGSGGQGGQQQQGGQQTTIQGPTIVFPGMSGTPTVTPAPQ